MQEHQREMEGLLDNVRQLSREVRLQMLIINSYIPPEYQDMIDQVNISSLTLTFNLSVINNGNSNCLSVIITFAIFLLHSNNWMRPLLSPFAFTVKV